MSASPSGPAKREQSRGVPPGQAAKSCAHLGVSARAGTFWGRGRRFGGQKQPCPGAVSPVWSDFTFCLETPQPASFPCGRREPAQGQLRVLLIWDRSSLPLGKASGGGVGCLVSGRNRKPQWKSRHGRNSPSRVLSPELHASGTGL